MNFALARPLLIPLILLAVSGGMGPAYGQARAQTAEYVLSRYIESMGGRAQLERIRSVRLSGSVTYPDGTTHAITVLKKKPNSVRVALDTGTTRFIQAYDGKVAWFARETGTGTFTERMRGAFAATFIREAPLENVLINPRDTGVVLSLGPDVTVAFAQCYQLEARFPDGARIVHYIEKDTFLERRIMEYDRDGTLVSELIPGRFQTYSGVVFAMRIVRVKGETTLSTLQLDDVQLNFGLLDSAFSPPPELPPE